MEKNKTTIKDLFEMSTFLVGLVLYVWKVLQNIDPGIVIFPLAVGLMIVAVMSHASNEKYGVLFTISKFKFTKRSLEVLIGMPVVILIFLLSKRFIENERWRDLPIFIFLCLYWAMRKKLKLVEL